MSDRIASPAVASPLRTHGRTALALLTVLLLAVAPARAQDDEEAKEAEEPAPPAEEAPEAGAKAPADAKPRVELPKDGTTPSYWVLEFKPGPMRMITPRSGSGAGGVYWYMLYTVENPSKHDRDILLAISASTDRGQAYSDLYLPDVERAIELREGKEFWGRTEEQQITSKRDVADPKSRYVTLKAGQKRASVAVFNRIDPNSNAITISVTGLSNEIRPVVKPDGGKVLEERVRQLKYYRAGDEFAITRDSFKLVEEEWIRRQVGVGQVGAAGAGAQAKK